VEWKYKHNQFVIIGFILVSKGEEFIQYAERKKRLGFFLKNATVKVVGRNMRFG